MTHNDAFYQLIAALQPLYSPSEAAAIAHEVMEHLTGLQRLARLTVKNEPLPAMQQQEWECIKDALITGKPMQQVLGYAWFMGRRFMVNEHVLIPRPETEELVQWIIDDYKNAASTFTVLDVGTGSGCIPVSVAASLPLSVVEACDISSEALAVALKNAAALGQQVSFFRKDILSAKTWEPLPVYDVIVSNPPYIPISEKEAMDVNVRDHDPGLALFVPDEDPLVFYKAIAALGQRHLAAGGAIYCEVHQDYALATADMFREAGYQALLRKDIFDNYRMVKAFLM